ncbi:MAG: hypothetical protein Q7R55_00205 [Candidatus Wildermuthbacteria bacterium]|nr:hypothetical protein [Candidatus Wildermuthbacteria bacterium]
MKTEYSKERLWKAYQQLPEELREAIAFLDVADHIYEIAQNNGVDVEDDQSLKTISQLVAYTLMGLLLPSDLEKELRGALNLTSATSKKIAQQLNRLVFYPVKPALEQLHKLEIEVSAKVVTPQPVEPSEQEAQTPEQKPIGDDSYREPIE